MRAASRSSLTIRSRVDVIISGPSSSIWAAMSSANETNSISSYLWVFEVMMTVSIAA